MTDIISKKLKTVYNEIFPSKTFTEKHIQLIIRLMSIDIAKQMEVERTNSIENGKNCLNSENISFGADKNDISNCSITYDSSQEINLNQTINFDIKTDVCSIDQVIDQSKEAVDKVLSKHSLILFDALSYVDKEQLLKQEDHKLNFLLIEYLLNTDLNIGTDIKNPDIIVKNIYNLVIDTFFIFHKKNFNLDKCEISQILIDINNNRDTLQLEKLPTNEITSENMMEHYLATDENYIIKNAIEKFFSKLGMKRGTGENNNSIPIDKSFSPVYNPDGPSGMKRGTRENNLSIRRSISPRISLNSIITMTPFLIYNFENALNLNVTIYDMIDELNNFKNKDSLIKSIIDLKNFIQNNIINSGIMNRLQEKIHKIFIKADKMIIDQYKMFIKSIILSFDKNIFIELLRNEIIFNKIFENFPNDQLKNILGKDTLKKILIDLLVEYNKLSSNNLKQKILDNLKSKFSNFPEELIDNISIDELNNKMDSIIKFYLIKNCEFFDSIVDKIIEVLGLPGELFFLFNFGEFDYKNDSIKENSEIDIIINILREEIDILISDASNDESNQIRDEVFVFTKNLNILFSKYSKLIINYEKFNSKILSKKSMNEINDKIEDNNDFKNIIYYNDVEIINEFDFLENIKITSIEDEYPKFLKSFFEYLSKIHSSTPETSNFRIGELFVGFNERYKELFESCEVVSNSINILDTTFVNNSIMKSKLGNKLFSGSTQNSIENFSIIPNVSDVINNGIKFVENINDISDITSQISEFVSRIKSNDFNNFNNKLNEFIRDCDFEFPKNFFSKIIKIINKDTKNYKQLVNLIVNKESTEKIEATTVNYIKYFFENHLSLIEPYLSQLLNNLDVGPNDYPIWKEIENLGILERKFIIKKITKINKYIKNLKVQDINETNYVTKLPLLIKSLIDIYFHLSKELKLLKEISKVIDCNRCKLENVLDENSNPDYNRNCSDECKELINNISDKFL